MIKIKAILIVILSIFIVSCSFRKGPEPEITPVLDEQLSYADSIAVSYTHLTLPTILLV